MKSFVAERGVLAVSLAGHDKGRTFAIIKADGEYAFIADGAARSVDKPKRKKLKHLKPLNITLDLDRLNPGTLTDGDLRRAIEAELKEMGG